MEYSECVSAALVIWYAKRMRHIVICCLYHICLTVTHKRHDSPEKSLKYVFWFSLKLTETFLILRRIQPNIIIHLHTYLCKVAVILVRFSWNMIFLQIFNKILKYEISWKYIQGKSRCCMRTNGWQTDGLTNLTELILQLLFRSFAKAAGQPRATKTSFYFFWIRFWA